MTYWTLEDIFESLLANGLLLYICYPPDPLLQQERAIQLTFSDHSSILKPTRDGTCELKIRKTGMFNKLIKVHDMNYVDFYPLLYLSFIVMILFRLPNVIIKIINMLLKRQMETAKL